MELQLRICNQCVIKMVDKGFDLERVNKQQEWRASCSGCGKIDMLFRWKVEVVPT